MALHNEIGKWGECKAAEYLHSLGLYLRHVDWHYGHMDLDIVCIDEDMSMIVVVEVKTRSSDEYGEPDEAINLEKQHNIIAATRAYLNACHLHHLQVRYDTISVIGTPESSCRIVHKENAFDILNDYQFYENHRQHIKPYHPF